jgi:hypothetical protein
MSSDHQFEHHSLSDTSMLPNVVAWAGIGFAVVAAVLYSVLFMMLSELPSTRNELEELKTNAPALTRLLVVGASAGLLNVVALILCLIGYVVSRGSKVVAAAGSVGAAVMLLAIFSVVVASLIVSS